MNFLNKLLSLGYVSPSGNQIQVGFGLPRVKNYIFKEKKQLCLDSLLLLLPQRRIYLRITYARVLLFIAVGTESQLLIAEKESPLTDLPNLAISKKICHWLKYKNTFKLQNYPYVRYTTYKDEVP